MRRITVVVLAAGVAAAAGACAERPRDGSVAHASATASAAAVASSSSSAPRPPAPPAADAGEEATLALPIPARAHAPEAPAAGWCGETAIQEGLLHLGVWAPQRLINKAGKPTHPDLYSPDIPVALSELGVRYSFYAGARGFDAFARWVGAAVDEGDPVLAGVKILPTAHPEWGLDHFVLVVGHGPKGLLVNTTWGSRTWVADTTTPGLSFKNAFYAIRLSGRTLPPDAHPARLAVLDEGEAKVKLRVTCAGPSKDAPSTSKDVTVEAAHVSRFECPGYME